VGEHVLDVLLPLLKLLVPRNEHFETMDSREAAEKHRQQEKHQHYRATTEYEVPSDIQGDLQFEFTVIFQVSTGLRYSKSQRGACV
jgi:hypothetical protein